MLNFYKAYINLITIVSQIYLLRSLNVKFIIDILVCIIRALQIHKISEASESFGKVILSATFNILFQSIVTSIFRPTEEKDDSEHLVQAPTNKGPTINIYPPIQSKLQTVTQERKSI